MPTLSWGRLLSCDETDGKCRLCPLIIVHAVLVILLGLLVLVGWTFNLNLLTRIVPSFVTMKANTAISFALMGLVLLLSKSAAWRAHRRMAQARWVLITIVGLIAVLTLSEYVFGVNAYIDELLFIDYEHHGTHYPAGRLSPITAINFLLLGAAFILMNVQPKASQGLAIVAFLISLLGAVGYFYHLQSLYGLWSPVSLALHTTIGFLLLSIGALACREDQGITKLLVRGPGARSNRWLLLGALSLPIALGHFIVLGYHAMKFGGEFGFALFTILVTLSFVSLFWITARARYAAEEALQTSEQQFRILANAIPHLAWMADETGHIFWYNRRWFDYTGTTLEEMEGWGWQKVHDPKFLPAVLTHWKAALQSGEPFEMTFPLRSAGGEFRTFLTRVEPLSNANEGVVRWFGTNTDITDQTKISEELRRINGELEEFAYAASHDLQEPLRMVSIYTQRLVKSADKQNENLNQYAEFIKHGVSRMQFLIRDLLQYSRVSHVDEDVPVGRADLSAAFTEALCLLKDRLEESSASITAEALPTIQGDLSQMANVFQNLFSNSLKYRRQDIAPEIHISAELVGKQWVISVQDNGIGFEPQYADRIFGLFKRLHKEEYPGTGIGLAICKRIVERYGGRIWAEGAPSIGATIHFSLPSIDVEEHAADPVSRG